MSDNARALVSVPHTLTPGRSIWLYPKIPPQFSKLMAALYPLLASTVSTKTGYSAFAGDGRFIGIMTSTGLTSIRRNPFLIDDTDLFLRALLAGLAFDGRKTCSMYCDWDNYGTLRMMQKLGLGAKPEGKKGGHRSTLATPDTTTYLAAAVDAAREPYRRHREYAEKQIAQFTGAQISALIPTVSSLGVDPAAHMDVTLTCR